MFNLKYIILGIITGMILTWAGVGIITHPFKFIILCAWIGILMGLCERG